ncbi:zinc ribbon domain-containing protein, partial [Streptomyces sp. NPDC003487]
MSQMPQQAALSNCPSCAEPLESGDRFCGACGYDLSAVPAPPQDQPTIAMHGAAPGRPGPGAAAANSPADIASAWRSRGPWCAARASSC